jgi:arylsulfatase A-like enzyme
MPDQMRGDCLSALKHPVVRTPHLDELASQGTLFRRAYSTVPSCIPARYAMLTGLYPQTSGVVGYRNKQVDLPTMPVLLAEAGYATALVGRNMHQVYGDTSDGYQKRKLGSTYVAGDDYDTDLLRAAPDCGGIRKVVETLGISNNGWNANPWPLADELHPTAWIVAQSRHVVADTPADQPLFLTASFYAPHPPLFPPQTLFDAYLQNTNLPPAAHGDWVDWKSLSPGKGLAGHWVLLEGETLRRAQAGYFGLIEHLDSQIAPLVAEFKARSVRAGRPWVIVVTSDHGEMLGDHGYFRKCEPYEGSANIPLIVAGSPELGFRPGQRCFQPVCLEDILPTLADLAAAGLRVKVDGVSLAPTLRGDDRTIRPWLHSEHAPCYGKEQAFHALTDGQVKYIWRPASGREHLFDLNQDPREEHDLAPLADHRTVLEHWRGVLIERLAQRPEGFSDGKRLIPGRPYPPLQAKR